MSALAGIEWEECFLEQRSDPELESYVREAFGAVPSTVAYYSPCPWLVRAQVALRFDRGLLAHTDLALADLIWMAVSQGNSCRFCYDTQRALLRLAGFAEARIRELERDWAAAAADPKARAALDFAQYVSRSNPLPAWADAEPLRAAGYSDLEIRELAFFAGSTAAANRLTTLAALPPDPIVDLPNRWYIKLLGPLLARRLRGRRKQGQPEFLSEEEQQGPFAYVVRALDGLPAARILRTVIDDLWSSQILPRRTKALVIAGVARTLGCKSSEQEARRLLAAEGIAEDEAETILSHLGSPSLDPIEAAALRFARETVWYQPAPIQRQGRALAEQMSQGQFLELMGVASFANAICRVGFLTEPG